MELAGDGECSVPEPTRSGSTTRRSHSEAERKRRQRINAHLATLRSLLPSASQMDKAALLGEVVRRVRELRDGAAAGGAVVAVAPGERDEVGVEDAAGETARRVKAWVCCADRPGLMSELARAVRSVSATAVRAEIATVGGRTRSVLELDLGQTATATAASRPELQAALRAVLLSQEEEQQQSSPWRAARDSDSRRFAITQHCRCNDSKK